MKKIIRKTLIAISLLALYLITAVPVGLFIYTLKSDLGVNVFNKTGYHGFTACLEEQIEKIKD